MSIGGQAAATAGSRTAGLRNRDARVARGRVVVGTEHEGVCARSDTAAGVRPPDVRSVRVDDRVGGRGRARDDFRYARRSAHVSIRLAPADACAPAGDRTDHRRLAIAFSQITGKGVDEVLFSGQDQLPGFIGQAGTWSLGALAWLIVFKGLVYLLSLGSFRGGPPFPALFLGAARGIMCSHLPGFPLSAAVPAGRDGRHDRRRAPAAALSGGARDAADIAYWTEGRATDHPRRRRRVRRDARHDAPPAPASAPTSQSAPVPAPTP